MATTKIDHEHRRDYGAGERRALKRQLHRTERHSAREVIAESFRDLADLFTMHLEVSRLAPARVTAHASKVRGVAVVSYRKAAV